MQKRTSFFILLFLSSLILLSFFSGCLFKPPVTEGILKGQVIVPEGTLQEKDLTGQALPNATVNIIDPVTGAIIATTTTDADGYYQVFVPAGGPYILEAVKDGVKLQQVTPQVEIGIEYELGTADCSTTSVALIAQAMVDAEDYQDNLADINLADIEANPDFDDVMNPVCSTIEAGGDPTELAVVQQAVEDFLYPPTPTPAPAPPTPLTAIAAITGTPKVGETLTAGALTPSVATATYQWKICATSGGTYTNIASATSTTYTAVAGDVTKFIKVTATGTGNYTGTVTSAATTEVTAAACTVTYDGNGSTSGTVPAGPVSYALDATVTVLGNMGTLVKTQDGISLLFTGWNATADGSGTGYIEADTFNMGSANVILYAQWSVLRGTGPAGGLIFYDKGSVSDGWQYLEAAPSDQSIGIEWITGGGTQTTLNGNTLATIGKGRANTNYMIAQTDYTGGAAKVCDDYSVKPASVTYNDWFLPSKEELNKMYVNLKSGTDENDATYTPVGGFAADNYWSSSENIANSAWSQQFFPFGFQPTATKNTTYRVRPVRAFRSTAPTYIVNYNANGATGGTVPSDGYHYELAETVTVLGNTGSLVKTQDGISLLFTGWNTAADGSGNDGTDYTAGDTFNMGSANVILYAQWSVLRGTGPAGGLIFYDKGSVSDGWQYLEAAPSDQTSRAWGTYDYTVLNADGTAVGTGKQNTLDIIAGDNLENKAADECAIYSIVNGGVTYDDWFLPSQDELAAMRTNLASTPENRTLYGFGTANYWSSSEYDKNTAWVQNFDNGDQNHFTKGTTLRVRAVRAF